MLLKFDQVVIFFSFKENAVDQRIYLKISGVNPLFVLIIDYILFACTDVRVLSWETCFC